MFDACHAPVHRYVLRRCGDPDLADDVVSDVFLSAWRGLERVPAPRRVDALVRRHGNGVAMGSYAGRLVADRIAGGPITLSTETSLMLRMYCERSTSEPPELSYSILISAGPLLAMVVVLLVAN